VAKRNRKRYYAYLKPGERGIVESWPECEARVSGTEARYRGFPTRQEAEAWLDAGAPYEARARVRREARQDLPEDAIYFDAGTGRGKGTEVRVTDRDGTPLTFLFRDEGTLTPQGNLRLHRRTNNYGELLACGIALRIALDRGCRQVMGDSRLVLDYWSRGRIRRDTAADGDLRALVERVAALRNEFEADGGRLSHVSGDLNPADLGFHR